MLTRWAHSVLTCVNAGDTCDLLIIDRPFDLMATVMHEWSYEAMATDLLAMHDNVFQYETETQAGEMYSSTHDSGHAICVVLDLNCPTHEQCCVSGKKEKREHVLNEVQSMRPAAVTLLQECLGFDRFRFVARTAHARACKHSTERCARMSLPTADELICAGKACMKSLRECRRTMTGGQNCAISILAPCP